MQELPLGIQSFERLRAGNYLYVDKTSILLDLISKGERYFLSRPRRFGKSLTLSTLEAMFKGKTSLFNGLKAENWVRKQAEKPFPVIKLDMSGLGMYSNARELNLSIMRYLKDIADDNGLDLEDERTCDELLRKIIRLLHKKNVLVVILIDEYDKPILDNIYNLQKAHEMREILRSFYTMIKSCDEYLRFVFLTGISKLSKTGLFSAMNNLIDISMVRRYGDIVGYTQSELEENFSEWIAKSSRTMSLNQDQLLKKIKSYYDGFSFDGLNRLYNPFSILNFFLDEKFGNYWYTSGSPSFIIQYMRKYKILDPEQYRHIEVPSDFSDSHEIENAKPESFLYQSGYLTIEKWDDDVITLDYPNDEVKKSLIRMYLCEIYHIDKFITFGTQIWKYLKDGNIEQIVVIYNAAIANIPYDDFNNRNEFWYRSLFVMLLRGAGAIPFAEVHTYQGRSDIVIQFEKQIIVLEFKYAHKTSDVYEKTREGYEQIKKRGYEKGYAADGRTVRVAVLVADDEKRQVLCVPRTEGDKCEYFS